MCIRGDVGITHFGSCFCRFVQRVWVAFKCLGAPYRVRRVMISFLAFTSAGPSPMLCAPRDRTVNLTLSGLLDVRPSRLTGASFRTQTE
ncbi:hypothetical protein BJV74DRAFT_863151 [Russula compacta]|nr:hypothetical protein BJV74DRAFT_863151 [Russula compacta]